MTVIKSLA